MLNNANTTLSLRCVAWLNAHTSCNWHMTFVVKACMFSASYNANGFSEIEDDSRSVQLRENPCAGNSPPGLNILSLECTVVAKRQCCGRFGLSRSRPK